LLSHESPPSGEVLTPSPAARTGPIGTPATSKQQVPAKRAPRRASSRKREKTPWGSDQELVRQILAGSPEHFEMLYEAYFPRVYRFALKRLRDTGEAEDVTQEVFVTVFRALQSFKGESSLLVWIFGITRNKVNRCFRGVRPRLESLDADGDGPVHQVLSREAPTDQAVDARRMLAHCEHVIETRLTPLQRRIFHLKHLRRQSIRSIAGALGKSEDAIKANLYRMRRAIADAAPGLDQILGA
jgi:RNA polymerase sigma-70 factor (ECF subfamily)